MGSSLSTKKLSTLIDQELVDELLFRPLNGFPVTLDEAARVGAVGCLIGGHGELTGQEWPDKQMEKPLNHCVFVLAHALLTRVRGFGKRSWLRSWRIRIA
jgi:hypothetical protein